MRKEVLKQDSKNNLKQFLQSSANNLWEKVDVRYKCLNKINLNNWIFWPTSLTSFFVSHITKMQAILN